MKIAILGAGAFGTALACTLDATQLWCRDRDQAALLHRTRENSARLPGVRLPSSLNIISELEDLQADIVLLAIPMQQTRAFVDKHRAHLTGRSLVACSKGVDLDLMIGPVGVIRSALPQTGVALLTGPSFAEDIARGLPTALTLACSDKALGLVLQDRLSTPTLRLYRNSDVIGAELGGALKNVIAIAAGVTIGAGLGESARAALMARGYAEMQRLALSLGAQPATLAGLSGLGDLILTCGSEKSRNFRYGLALGEGAEFDQSTTVEGVATARAVARLAQARGLEMPITRMVAALTEGVITLSDARAALLARPLTEE